MKTIPSIVARFVAISLGFLFASATTFLGLMASFTGFGSGLTSVASHYLTVSMGVELPFYAILVCISRKTLAVGCCTLCVLDLVGAFLLRLSDYSGALHRPAIWRLVLQSILFPGTLLSLLVAGIAVFLYSQQIAIDQNDARAQS